ncbi:hypothetical protein OU997_09895 [Pseudomonas sp. SL4(2022)]|uniref:hypothetical protein n=1 Tax=Pseudomonas sp. SL4(2022) TaxID=2994661 RepID=UPI00226EE6F1|nr:hypothetical protein [Pseudomonas sp. SL4(2022)]WAC46443.1 hypothetical protein OU997_09895 [Pseudomonas sp. SL4(2022)]
MLKIIYPTISCLALVLAGEVAADSQKQEITYTAVIQIPTVNFYVFPINRQLFTEEHNLHWNVSTARFSPFLTYLKVRNNAGGITARTTANDTHLNNISSNKHSLPVHIAINKIKIDTLPRTIVDAKTALHETTIPLELTVPEADLHPGQYKGSIRIIFESEAP